jgi:hypothetical protein
MFLKVNFPISILPDFHLHTMEGVNVQSLLRPPAGKALTQKPGIAIDDDRRKQRVALFYFTPWAEIPWKDQRLP